MNDLSSLVRRIAALEEQLATLREVITVNPWGTVEIRSRGRLELLSQNSVTIHADDDLVVHCGGTQTVTAGRTFKLTAGDRIGLKTGSAELDLKKSGDLLIDGKDIDIRASGKLNAKASSDVVLKGSKILQN